MAKSKTVVYRMRKNDNDFIVKVVIDKRSWDNEVKAGLPMDNNGKFQVFGDIAIAPGIDIDVKDVKDFVEEDFRYAIVTSYAGTDLFRWVMNNESDPSARKRIAQEVARQILKLWGDATSDFQGCHGDLKLENLMVSDEDETISLIDWESYKTEGTHNSSSPFSFFGTPNYMHPGVLKKLKKYKVDLSTNFVEKSDDEVLTWEDRKLNDAFAALMVIHTIMNVSFVEKKLLVSTLGSSEAGQQLSKAVELIRRLADQGKDPFAGDMAAPGPCTYKIVHKDGNQLQLVRDNPLSLIAVHVHGDDRALVVGADVDVIHEGLQMKLEFGEHSYKCDYCTPRWNVMIPFQVPDPQESLHSKAKSAGRRQHRKSNARRRLFPQSPY